MKYYTDIQPKWLKWIVPEKFNDTDLFRIVIFYVFHCPSEKSSYMRKSLKEYGWNTPWRKPYKLNKQLINVTNNEHFIYSSSTLKDLDLALDKADLVASFPNNIALERVAIYDNKKNQFESILCHIRNAFAHCRINMIDFNNECIFVLEDGRPNSKDKSKFEVSARMILKKKTLLKWIEIIENGEKELEI